MTWKERLIGIPLALVGAALLAVTAAGMLLTRTDWGRERVRAYALEKLNAAISGQVQIDEILEGDLLRMVSMAGVRIIEEDGREFARLDTLTLHYRWSDFLFGDVTFAKATLVHPVVNLRDEPEGGWNLERIFSSPSEPADSIAAQEPSADGDGGTLVELRDVTIRGGVVTLRIPWNPADGTDPDSVRWHLEHSADAWWRVLRFEELDTRLTVARVAAPAEQDRLFQVVQFTTRATILDDPFLVEQLRAYVEVDGNKLSFDVSRGQLAGSEMFGNGWVTLESDTRYAFNLSGDPITTDDLQWLLPWLPSGRAHLDLELETLPDGLSLLAQNARWESPDAEVRGRFGLSLHDRPDGVVFDELEVDVRRLHTSLIAELTGWTPPIPAVLSGPVALDGPLSELDVDAALDVRPQNDSVPTRVTASGTVRAWHIWPGELGAGELEVEVTPLRLALVREFFPGFPVRGRVTGNARLDGTLASGLAVDFQLTHRDRRIVPTVLAGAGRLRYDTAGLYLDMGVRADSLSLTTWSQYSSAILFRGDFTGDLQARGYLDDLEVEAVLAGAGDSIRFNGDLQLAEGPPRYSGTLTGRRIRIVPFREGLAESDIDFRAEFSGRGGALNEIQARANLYVFSSFVGGVRLDTAYSDLRIREGRLAIDSAMVQTEFGSLTMSGDLGLTAGSEGQLAFEIAADSLGGLAPWVFPGYGRLAGPGLATDGDGLRADEEPRAEIGGAARISGEFAGMIGDLEVSASLAGNDVRYGGWATDSLVISDFEVAGIGESARLGGRIVAMGLSTDGFRLDRLDAVGALVGGSARLEFDIAVDTASGARGRLAIERREDLQRFSVEELEVRLGESAWRMETPTFIELASSGALSVDSTMIAGPIGHVAIGGVINDSGPAAFGASVAGVEVGELAALTPDSLDVAGTLTATARLSGRTRDPVVRGEFEIVDGSLLGIDFSSLRGDLEYQAGVANIDLDMRTAEARLFRLQGTYPIALKLPRFAVEIPDRPIDLTLQGDSVPLNLASLIFGDQVADLRGYASASVAIGGRPGDLELTGPGRLVDGGFRVLYTGVAYRDLNGELEFSGQNVRLSGVLFEGVPIRRNATGGRGRLNGTIRLSDLGNPGFDLTLRGRELPLYDQLDARFVVSGTARLTGEYEAPVVRGDLAVVSGALYIDEIGRQAEIIDPYIDPLAGGFVLIDSIGLTEVRPAGGNPFIDNLTMDSMTVEVQRDTWLRSAEANVEIAGTLQISRRPGQEGWRMDGTLQALRGDYRLFNKRFEVSEGTIEFVGQTEMNPNIRIVALYTLRTAKKPIEIRLIIGGTLEQMTLSLESDAQPPIPESDLLSYLLFGRPAYEITRSTDERSLLSDVTADVPQAFLGYALGSLLVGETGLAYIDVSRVNYVNETGGEYQEGVGPALGTTQVEVGWYLAPTVFVSVAQHLAGAIRPTVRLEWKLDDRFTVRGITQPRFGEASKLIFEELGANLEQSIGLFLFYGWSY
ncbi:MAG: translocation/assembly module TamB [Gemmatimonadetes bacterium]|uniref:Translocation/assembly module TamB n=1 Tax=Candidatus Kutchimonas denitrificans TaxID=3056748 RepID=A0AAE4ZAF6_9BACT|nr:translocation/assembly module TamB [Gemmatimonadota bacterium]NIR75532.1 translocation/assembly module TamB [Candidatus Kutchimonas denitrificans]NIS01846.1 translocation/assembly module TamB [Gemmatimonadota bacterium]NIT67627.1 translocation/assembly module TamB [Gemmatimonadota bacterium]NIU53501.1 hypothetical protein [Gemmatimonadota bacterium]